MPELRRDGDRVFLCGVPRCANGSILSMFKASGWSVDYEILGREEGFSPYQTQEVHFRDEVPASFAFIRHPMRRLESVIRDRLKASTSKEVFDRFLSMNVGDVYRKSGGSFRPAHDLVMDSTEIFKIDRGLHQPLTAFRARRWLPWSVVESRENESKGNQVDWTKAPARVVEKVLKDYAQDFYHFDYLTFPEDD